ncbi:hypothetical protein HDU88_004951 [Geranomyces variabilis]|nr:hypothetical protein HDU88_004951 [Geranomyces variabilis]
MAAALGWRGICRLRRCSRRLRDALADAVPILPLYIQFSTLLELEAAKRDPSFEWDIVDGIISGRLKSVNLLGNRSVLFMLNQENEASNGNSEKIGWNVVSAPLASSSAEFAEAPIIIFSIFYQTGFIRKYYEKMEEEEIFCEIPGKLPPTVIYRKHQHARDGATSGNHCFPALSRLLNVSEDTIVRWLAQISTGLFGNVRHTFNNEPLDMDELQPEKLYEARRYRNAMQKFAGGEISEAIKRLDSSVPRCELDLYDFWKALQQKVGRLHAAARMARPESLYQALCSHNAEALASEGESEYDALSWIAEIVLFCKCRPCNRLRGIEYGISGHPFSAEFLLKEPRNAAADWESPVFTIKVVDCYAYNCNREHIFFLSTSWNPKTFSQFHQFGGRSQSNVCAFSLDENQNIATQSEEEMEISAKFLEGLWR